MRERDNKTLAYIAPQDWPAFVAASKRASDLGYFVARPRREGGEYRITRLGVTGAVYAHRDLDAITDWLR